MRVEIRGAVGFCGKLVGGIQRMPTIYFFRRHKTNSHELRRLNCRETVLAKLYSSQSVAGSASWKRPLASLRDAPQAQSGACITTLTSR